ncbi:MAG: amino acid ABC transporter permease [Desulfuromonadales bacterium]|nr:amino acid ABC transporter permease [Desulfuromonadales bacterium]
MSYNFQFNVINEYLPYLMEGAWFTIRIGFWSIFYATIIGLILATLQMSHNRFLKICTVIYIDIFRTIPLVVLLIWIHYVLPIFIGTSFTPEQSAILALSLNGGAMASEAFRGGLEAIPLTQMQASYSLGFSHFGTLRYVVIPQAVFSTLPPLTNVYITNIKNISVTMIIAVPEIMFRAQEVMVQTFRPLELYTAAAIVYIVLIVVFSYAMRFLEKLRKWEPI